MFRKIFASMPIMSDRAHQRLMFGCLVVLAAWLIPQFARLDELVAQVNAKEAASGGFTLGLATGLIVMLALETGRKLFGKSIRGAVERLPLWARTPSPTGLGTVMVLAIVGVRILNDRPGLWMAGVFATYAVATLLGGLRSKESVERDRAFWKEQEARHERARELGR